MGGDFAPAAAVEGGILFALQAPSHHVLLVGDEGKVRPLVAELSGRHGPPSNLSVHHASEVVDMGDPIQWSGDCVLNPP